MRQSQKSNRARNKNGRKSHVPSPNRVYESTGPEGKVRGTPQQIIEKYQSLSRDKATAGDRVLAESFMQHAEHYIRILGAAQTAQQQRREEREEDQDNEVAEEAEAETARAAASSDPMAVIGEDDAGSEIVPTPESMAEPRRPRQRDGGGEGGDDGAEPTRRKTRRPSRRSKSSEERGKEDRGAAEASDAAAGGNGAAEASPPSQNELALDERPADWSEDQAARVAG